MSSKGFHAEVVARHLSFMPGDKLYLKACGWHFSVPTTYKILDRDNGQGIGFISASEFKNRFIEI